jgi:hypothetical protein
MNSPRRYDQSSWRRETRVGASLGRHDVDVSRLDCGPHREVDPSSPSGAACGQSTSLRMADARGRARRALAWQANRLNRIRHAAPRSCLAVSLIQRYYST